MNTNKESEQFLKEEKIAYRQSLKKEEMVRKQSLKKKKKPLTNKQGDKNYVLSDFDLRFKNSPKYQKEFREVEVKYSYRNQAVIYYLFVRKELNNEEALASARNQIKHLIRTGEMKRYAKYFCHAMR